MLRPALCPKFDGCPVVLVPNGVFTKCVFNIGMFGGVPGDGAMNRRFPSWSPRPTNPFATWAAMPAATWVTPGGTDFSRSFHAKTGVTAIEVRQYVSSSKFLDTKLSVNTGNFG